MELSSSPTYRNRLITLLPADDQARVRAHLEPVDFPVGMVLSAPKIPARYAYFLEDGVGSITAVSQVRANVQVALFGREGMSPVSAVHGAGWDKHLSVIKVAGTGYRMEITTMNKLVAESETFRAMLGHYAHTVMTQIAHSAHAIAAYRVEQQVSRMLLMYHDRIEGNAVVMTHHSISAILAVRRATITLAIHRLENEHAIQASRGLMTILDRQRLEVIAEDAYGGPEEYRRLIGLMR